MKYGTEPISHTNTYILYGYLCKHTISSALFPAPLPRPPPFLDWSRSQHDCTQWIFIIPCRCSVLFFLMHTVPRQCMSMNLSKHFISFDKIFISESVESQIFRMSSEKCAANVSRTCKLPESWNLACAQVFSFSTKWFFFLSLLLRYQSLCLFEATATTALQ